MKLYATVTSERASKGQGGNKMLSIDIFYRIEGSTENLLAGCITVKSEANALTGKDVRIMWHNKDAVSTILAILPTTKGEKQKGEHTHKWIYAGMCEGEESPETCGRKTYSCKCGAYKDCDGGIN